VSRIDLVTLLSGFMLGWVFGDIWGWRKGWREGMKIVEKYKALIHHLTAYMRDPERPRRKDLPS
jgi:hypothetical protein